MMVPALMGPESVVKPNEIVMWVVEHGDRACEQRFQSYF